jgi:hypothetical protein
VAYNRLVLGTVSSPYLYIYLGRIPFSGGDIQGIARPCIAIFWRLLLVDSVDNLDFKVSLKSIFRKLGSKLTLQKSTLMLAAAGLIPSVG